MNLKSLHPKAAKTWTSGWILFPVETAIVLYQGFDRPVSARTLKTEFSVMLAFRIFHSHAHIPKIMMILAGVRDPWCLAYFFAFLPLMGALDVNVILQTRQFLADLTFSA